MNEGDRAKKSAPRAPSKSARLGAALRENLKRRKEQTRARVSAEHTNEVGPAKPRGE